MDTQAPKRWKDLPPEVGAREAAAAAAVRQLRPTAAPTDETVERLLVRLQREVLDVGPVHPLGALGAWLRLRWRLWLAGLSTLLGFNLVLAAIVIYGRHSPAVVPAAPAVEIQPPTVVAPPSPVIVEAQPPQLVSPTLHPAVISRRHAPATAPVPSVAAPAPVAAPGSGPVGPVPSTSAAKTDTLLEESALVSRGVRELRETHDPGQALQTLKGYLSTYPSGALRTEAEVAELEALLALGHTPDALALLDRFSARDFQGVPRSAELRVLRGELLTQARRFAEALPSFEGAAGEGPAALQERALFGRALCRAGLGDVEGSRRDFEGYLKLFPQGGHAEQARQALKRP